MVIAAMIAAMDFRFTIGFQMTQRGPAGSLGPNPYREYDSRTRRVPAKRHHRKMQVTAKPRQIVAT
jgi:hypothetical protein